MSVLICKTTCIPSHLSTRRTPEGNDSNKQTKTWLPKNNTKHSSQASCNDRSKEESHHDHHVYCAGCCFSSRSEGRPKKQNNVLALVHNMAPKPVKSRVECERKSPFLQELESPKSAITAPRRNGGSSNTNLLTQPLLSIYRSKMQKTRSVRARFGSSILPIICGPVGCACVRTRVCFLWPVYRYFLCSKT